MTNKFSFSRPLREGRNLKNGSAYSSHEREVDVNATILIRVMRKQEPTYSDFSELDSFVGVGANYLGRYCRKFERVSIRSDGAKSQTTKILATADNAGKAFLFLQDKAPERLESIAAAREMASEDIFDEIEEWLTNDDASAADSLTASEPAPDSRV